MDAKELYTRRKKDIAALLDWISLEVDQHAEWTMTDRGPGTDGPDYGDCGDLGHVRERLIQTLAFLAESDEEFIEEALNDAAAGRE